MTQVKICGLTNIEDVQVAVDASADFLGFIFFEKSPRYVTIQQVATITEFLRAYDAPRIPLCVGVFVNPTLEHVANVLEQTGIQAAQIHKVEPAKLMEMRYELRGSLYPVLQPRTASDVQPYRDIDADASAYPTAFWLPTLMIDAYHPDLAGGTGKQANLELASEIAAITERLMLAGGLTPENVATAVSQVQPFAVDVSSGVEAIPGKKDHQKVRDFIQAVRETDKELTS